MKTLFFGRGEPRYHFSTRPFSCPLLQRICLCLPPSRLSAGCIKNYRENRENGTGSDNPNRPFPNAGLDKLDIKSTNTQSGKWPDSQGRYWWKLTLQDGSVNTDFYWMEDEVRGYPDKSDENRYWFTVGHTNGTKIEGFSQEADYQKGFPDKDKRYWYYIQFTDTHCLAIRQWMEEKDFNYLKRIRLENPALFNQELTELTRDNPKHSAIPKLETILKEEKEGKEKLAQQQPQQPAYPPYQQAYPPQQQVYPPQQPQLQQYPQQREKELELEIDRLQLAIQQQSPVRPTTSDVSTREGKQKTTSQPNLNDDTIQQLALSIEYKEIKIIQELGEGDFGIVSYGQWRYEDVAVKKLRLQQLSPNALIEFKEEAAIMARLRSEYIVSLRGICLTPYALVMEYMHGGSLFNLLHSQTSLSWAMRQQIASDVAKGLAFLHSHQPNKILHCNLKSQNVLLTRDQRAKLADFGLAKVRVESSWSQIHAQSASKSVDNIPWTAPECLHHMRKYSRKSDMYAYGMVLWELTTRKIPYEKVTDPNEICEAITAGEREKIPDQITNPTEPIPVSIRRLIDLCWLRAPKRRPEAKEAIEILEQATQSQSSRSQSASSSSSMSLNGFMSNLLNFK